MNVMLSMVTLVLLPFHLPFWGIKTGQSTFTGVPTTQTVPAFKTFWHSLYKIATLWRILLGRVPKRFVGLSFILGLKKTQHYNCGGWLLYLNGKPEPPRNETRIQVLLR
jgi:hypothetical protein